MTWNDNLTFIVKNDCVPDSVEDKEALESSAIVGELTNAIEDKVDNLLADGVLFREATKSNRKMRTKTNLNHNIKIVNIYSKRKNFGVST